MHYHRPSLLCTLSKEPSGMYFLFFYRCFMSFLLMILSSQGPLTWSVPLTNCPTNFLHLGQTCLLSDLRLSLLPPPGSFRHCFLFLKYPWSSFPSPWLLLWAQPSVTSSEKPSPSGRQGPPSTPLNWNFTFVQLVAIIMSEKPSDLSSRWGQRFAGLGLPRARVSAWPTVGPQWTCVIIHLNKGPQELPSDSLRLSIQDLCVDCGLQWDEEKIEWVVVIYFVIVNWPSGKMMVSFHYFSFHFLIISWFQNYLIIVLFHFLIQIEFDS